MNPPGTMSVRTALEVAMNDHTVKSKVRSVERTADQLRDTMSERLDDAREGFEQIAEDLGDRLKDATVSAQRTGRRATKELRQKAERVRERAREKYDDAMEHLRAGYSRLQTDVGSAVDDVSDFVRENPGKSILIAAGVGFLLGLLIRRRRDNYDD